METHPVHPRDALPRGGHCSPASLSLFPTLPKERVHGHRATCPGLASCGCRAHTGQPRVCPRAACGRTSQGLLRPLVPPLPQTQNPTRLCSPASEGQSQVQGREAWLPRLCVLTFTCLPLTERTRLPTHARGPKGHPPPVSQRPKPRPPLCTLQPVAAAEAAPRLTGHGPRRSHQFSHVRRPTGQRRG